jgi:saccharopine dehydrogenase (NAD+, L-lysine-forming)
MSFTLGIRREDKNKWERRVPLVPGHIKELKEKHAIETIIQPSKIRIYSENDFKDAGALINEDLSSCPIIFAIKEVPIDFFEPKKTYVFFSHTIKGQSYNMPMLKKMMERGCNLVDYEKITDEKGHRLVFFGRFAGLAGMIDTLWAFGQRMKYKGIKTPFAEIKQAIHYKDLDDAKTHINKIGKTIEKVGLPKSLTPFIVGFAGYGNVSKGAQEILDILPIKEITPKQLGDIYKNFSDKVIYKVVFKEEDTVESISSKKDFDLQDYYNHPNLYRSIFNQYLEHLNILMNCILWNRQYPRLITKESLKKNYTEKMKLQVIGDISVDINGAIEFTEKVANPGNPVFIYNPLNDEIVDGFNSNGIVVMAVDNLPCEVPKESSKEFSDSLIPFIPSIVKADFSVDFKDLNLPSEIKKAVILHHGKLTQNYQYINKFL